MTAATTRTYAGQTGPARAAARREQLVSAGLSLMGSVGIAGTTVRSVLAEAGVAPRYFYESFTSIDDLHRAVFDSVVATAESRAAEVLKSGGQLASRESVRALIAAMVDYALSDPSAGRVFFIEAAGSGVLGARRQAALSQFSALLAQRSRPAWRELPAVDHRVLVTAQYAIGGFAETVAAVLRGDLSVARDDLLADLTELFISAGGALKRMP